MAKGVFNNLNRVPCLYDWWAPGQVVGSLGLPQRLVCVNGKRGKCRGCVTSSPANVGRILSRLCNIIFGRTSTILDFSRPSVCFSYTCRLTVEVELRGCPRHCLGPVSIRGTMETEMTRLLKRRDYPSGSSSYELVY